MRPSRGSFPVGSYVFYYDKPVGDTKHGPHNWKGIARVIGRDGSHRGILVAASPELLSLADDLEVRGWMVTSRETELLDATPAVTSNTFLDIRRKDIPPPEGFEELEDEEKDQDERERRPAETQQEPLEDGVPRDEVEVPEAEAEESDGYEPSIAPDQPEQHQIESMAEGSERAERPQSRKRREEFEEGMRRSENLRRRTLKSSKFF